jgi:hypothetical protein
VNKPAPSLRAFFDKLQSDKSGGLSMLVVIVVGAVCSLALWELFVLPAKAINGVLPDANCINEQPGTSAMRVCGMKVAAVKMVGPVVLAVLVVVFRVKLAKWVSRVSVKLHPGARPLVAPTLATLLFLLIWAGSHSKTADQDGLLPQRAFPAVVGAYTYAVVRYGPALQATMKGFFTKRERVPMSARIIVTVAIPTLFSLLITNQDRVSRTAMKEQIVVLLGLAIAYLLLSPRGGDIGASASKLLPLTGPAPVPAPAVPVFAPPTVNPRPPTKDHRA